MYNEEDIELKKMSYIINWNKIHGDIVWISSRLKIKQKIQRGKQILDW